MPEEEKPETAAEIAERTRDDNLKLVQETRKNNERLLLQARGLEP